MAADYRAFRDLIAARIQTVGHAGVVHDRILAKIRGAL